MFIRNQLCNIILCHISRYCVTSHKLDDPTRTGGSGVSALYGSSAGSRFNARPVHLDSTFEVNISVDHRGGIRFIFHFHVLASS